MSKRCRTTASKKRRQKVKENRRLARKGVSHGVMVKK